jgi:hypothetical protein
VQLFSSLKKIGLEEAEAVIAGWFDADDLADVNQLESE